MITFLLLPTYNSHACDWRECFLISDEITHKHVDGIPIRISICSTIKDSTTSLRYFLSACMSDLFSKVFKDHVSVQNC